jgi:nucleotide-binding universal stress UspA family protein
MFTPKKILVPTDFSAYADNALKNAIDLAKQYKAKVFLLHVIDDGFSQCAVDYCLDEAAVQKVLKDSIDNAKEKLQQEVKKINEDYSDIEIVYDTARGIPYEEIIKEQKDKKIDLIVIASHGKTGIMKNLIGSVSEKVMRNAKCPVLLVRS